MVLETAPQLAEVAQIMAASVPQPWRRAWLTAKAENGYLGDIKTDYELPDGQTKWFHIEDAAQDVRLASALLKARTAMTLPGQKPWTRCRFTLSSDGQFKLDVDYAD